MDSGSNLEQSENVFKNKGDFGNFSREDGNTDFPGGSLLCQ